MTWLKIIIYDYFILTIREIKCTFSISYISQLGIMPKVHTKYNIEATHIIITFAENMMSASTTASII